MSKPYAIVIDDNSSLAETFSTALAFAGFEVTTVVDSTTALDVICARLPDIIMLDMQMPIVSGKDILRAIRADEHLMEIKIIAVTASDRIAAELQTEDQADLVLIKPVRMHQIIAFASRLTQRAGPGADQ